MSKEIFRDLFRSLTGQQTTDEQHKWIINQWKSKNPQTIAEREPKPAKPAKTFDYTVSELLGLTLIGLSVAVLVGYFAILLPWVVLPLIVMGVGGYLLGR